jgi:hypothetical protein
MIERRENITISTILIGLILAIILSLSVKSVNTNNANIINIGNIGLPKNVVDIIRGLLNH